MSKKYRLPEERPVIVSEPVAVTYQYAEQTGILGLNVVTENPDLRRKEYLKANLHPLTVEYLDSVNWLENKPFPVYDDSADESWIEETEAYASADIVEDERIAQDRAAWNSVR